MNINANQGNKCGLIYYNTSQEVIIDECVEINNLFQKYEYCTLSYVLSSKQDGERPFSGHRVKLPIQLINYCNCFCFFEGVIFHHFETKKQNKKKTTKRKKKT